MRVRCASFASCVDLSDAPLLSSEALDACLDAQDQLARIGVSNT